MKTIDPPSKECLEAANQVCENYPNAWCTGICAYEGLDRQTGERQKVRWQQRGSLKGDICHAGLSYFVDLNPVVVNAHGRKWESKNPEFLLWCCQESPYAYGVLNRTEREQLLKHGSIIDFGLVGYGGSLWLCKAARHFVEDVWVPDRWSKLRDCGLNGLQAFIGASILDANGDKQNNNTHVNLFSYASPRYLRRAYDKLKDGAPFKKDGNIRDDGEGFCNNWGTLSGKVTRVSDGWGGFTEKKLPGGIKEYAAQLKEIFEGDPKNVD